jgi:hypothetical protein
MDLRSSLQSLQKSSPWPYSEPAESSTPLTEHQAMKACWGSGDIAPRILDLGIRWVVSFTPRPLYPQGKRPWCPLDSRLGGPQSRSGRGDEERDSHPCRDSNPRSYSFPCVFLTGHLALKVYCGSGGIAPRILDLGARWRWVVSFTLRPLYPQGKSPWYTLDRRLGGPQSRS